LNGVFTVIGGIVSLPRLLGLVENLPVTSCESDVLLEGMSSSWVSVNVAPGVPAAVSFPMSQVSVLVPTPVHRDEEVDRKVPPVAVSVTIVLTTLFPPLFVTVNVHPTRAGGFTNAG
jgi:hypothetical protein